MLRGLCLGNRLHVDIRATVLTCGEHYNTVDQGVDGVVLTHAYIQTRVVYSTTLTLDDVACFSCLSTKNLYAKAFAF